MQTLLRLVLLVIEQIFRTKNRKKYINDQKKIQEARNNPGTYLGQFGRVCYRDPEDSPDKLRRRGAIHKKHSGEKD